LQPSLSFRRGTESEALQGEVAPEAAELREVSGFFYLNFYPKKHPFFPEKPKFRPGETIYQIIDNQLLNLKTTPPTDPIFSPET
jgi:hypothetical protein